MRSDSEPSPSIERTRPVRWLVRCQTFPEIELSGMTSDALVFRVFESDRVRAGGAVHGC